MKSHSLLILLLLMIVPPFLRAQDDKSPETLLKLGEALEKSSGNNAKKQAFQYYCIAMSPECPAAYRKAGQCLLNGVGTKKDPAKAFKLFRVAAVYGCAEAWCDMGACFETGVGVERSQHNAEKCYLTAFEMGVPEGGYRVARLYENGYEKHYLKTALVIYQRLDSTWTFPEEDADPIYRLASKSDCAEAMYLVALRSPCTQDALLWLKDAADKGCAEASFELAKYYDFACPEFYHPKKALRYYLLAAALGNAEAEYELATLYESGRLVGEKDLNQAIHWYERAAEHGIAYAAKRAEELHLMAP